jgi:hypothetical protein
LWAWVLRFLLVVPAVLALSLLVLVWVTKALFAEFGWAVFHAIGEWSSFFYHLVIDKGPIGAEPKRKSSCLRLALSHQCGDPYMPLQRCISIIKL